MNYKVSQNNSYILTFNLVDENNNAISSAQLGTFVLTNYYYNPDLTTSDKNHLATINGRYNQDIKNTNNVTVTSGGTVTWAVQSADTPKLDSSTEKELHVALFTWMWSGKSNSAQVFFSVLKVNYAV